MSTDTTIQTFQADVIDASMEAPVLVDFWAEWCGPCKQLTPILEKLEQDYGGRFKLVKVDTEQEQELSQHFQIKSIPAVFAFVNGKPVDQFQGALPEGQLREFIDRLMPNPGAVEMDQAMQAVSQGNHDEAIEFARRAVSADPRNDQARLLIAQLALTKGDVGAAQGQMDSLSEAARANPQVAQLAEQIAQAVADKQVPPPPELLARVKDNPGDMQAVLDLSEHYVEHQMWEPAFEYLLQIVLTDREFKDDIGRKRMIEVFKLAAEQPALVSEWRRKLGSSLNVV